MSEQIFISYRRDGGDIYAKSICEALKNRGFTVFYDFDSLHGGCFDDRILKAIEGCSDFVLVLPPHALDRCVNKDDWVRLEIKHALEYRKNIVPVLLPGFSFPENFPHDIAEVTRYNGVQFVIEYFDAVVDTIVDRLSCPKPAYKHKPISTAKKNKRVNSTKKRGRIFKLFKNILLRKSSKGLNFYKNNDENSYRVINFTSKKRNKVKKIVIPAIYKNDSVTIISNEAFRGYQHLKKVIIPHSITTIGENAFAGCHSLRSITIPDSVSSIGDGAFSRCYSLRSITLPESIKTINSRTFKSCKKLKKITIPSSITNINDLAFYNCHKLRNVKFAGTIEQWKNITGNIIIRNADFKVLVIHCSDGDFKPF